MAAAAVKYIVQNTKYNVYCASKLDRVAAAPLAAVLRPSQHRLRSGKSTSTECKQKHVHECKHHYEHEYDIRMGRSMRAGKGQGIGTAEDVDTSKDTRRSGRMSMRASNSIVVTASD